MQRTLLTLCLAVLFLPQMGLYPKYASTSGSCEMKRGKTCYHTFTSSQTTTTADSGWYPVEMCVGGISYGGEGDGTAKWKIQEAGNGDGDGPNIFVPDIVVDSEINALDEAHELDGYTVGHRGYRAVPVAKPFQKIDVLTLPGSGTVYVQVTCL